MKRAILIAALVGVLVACAPAGDAEAPVAAVQRFVAALEARDAAQVLDTLPPDGRRRQLAPEVRIYLSVVERLVFREPTYELLANDGRQARVRMTATLDYAVRGDHAGERPIEAEFGLVMQDNAWYLDEITWPPLSQEGP